MFGIGTGELLLLALIALLVLGPERMPKLARDIGKTVGDLRRTSDELRSEFMNADRTLNIEKALDAATRTAGAPDAAKDAGAAAPPVGPAPPDAGATQAAVATEPSGPPPVPAEPEETAFDRELRLARERIDRESAPPS
jgi:sec-independent protein translocase protein TatB